MAICGETRARAADLVEANPTINAPDLARAIGLAPTTAARWLAQIKASPNSFAADRKSIVLERFTSDPRADAQALAMEIGVSDATVYRWRRETGGGYKEAMAAVKQAVLDRFEGDPEVKTRTMAADFGVRAGTIRGWIQQADLTRPNIVCEAEGCMAAVVRVRRPQKRFCSAKCQARTRHAITKHGCALVTCTTCGQEFGPDDHRYRNCSEVCRDVRTRRLRQSWNSSRDRRMAGSERERR